MAGPTPDPYRQLVDTCPDAIIVHASGEVVFANATAARLLAARTPDALQGIRLADLAVSGRVGPEDPLLQLQSEAGRAVRLDLRRLDGTLLGVEATTAATSFQGRPATQIVARPAAHRAGETAPAASGDPLLREFVQNAAEAMILCDENGQVVEWNRGAVEITGVRAEDAIGTALWATWHQFAGDEAATPEDRTQIRTEHARALQEGHAPWAGRMSISTIHRADGTTRIIEHRPFVVRTERGIRAGAIILDVTERERSVEALRASEEALREFVRHANDAIVVTDEDGRVVEWNEAAEALTGARRDEVVGMPYAEAYRRLLPDDLYTPEQRHRLLEGTARALATGEMDGFADRPLLATFRRPDGSTRHTVQRLFLVPTSRGRRLAAIAHDVTEQRRSRQLIEIQRDLGMALAATSDRDEAIRQALEAVMRIDDMHSAGAYLLDHRTGALELRQQIGVSDAFIAAASRYPPAAPETQAILASEVLNSVDQAGDAMMRQLIRGEGLRGLLAIPIQADGRVIGVLNLASRTVEDLAPVIRSAGEAIASQLGGALARITATESLRESEERHRRLIEEMGEGVGAVDPDEVFVVANRAAETIFGVEPGTLVGRSVAEFVEPETFRIVQAQTALRRAGERTTYEIEIVRPDGARRTIVLTSTPRLDERGEFAGAASVFADVTEQRRAEESLRRRAAFDELFAGTLTRFASCTGSDADERINEVLRSLAEFAGVDHVLVFTLAAGASSWSVTHEWCGEDVLPRRDTDRDLPLGTLPWSEARLLDSQTIRIATPDEYPPEAVAERAYVEAEGLRSALLVPMTSAAGTVVGALALHSHARPVTWSDQDVLRLRLVGDAIAGLVDRVTAESALRASEERFSKVFHSSPAPIAITRMDDGMVIEANDALHRMLGYEHGELVGHTVIERNIWADPADRTRLVAELRRGVPVRDRRTLFRHRDGHLLTTRYSAEVVSLGGETCLLSLLVDVTAQQQAEADRTRLIAAMEQSADAVLVTDADGLVVYANRSFETTFGRRREDVLGRPTTDAAGCLPALLPIGPSPEAARGESWIQAVDAVDAERHSSRTEWAVAPITGPEGEPAGYVAVARDRTAERALQERLNQAQKLEAVGLLAGGVAHDFNNLVTAIRGYAELIGRELPESDQRRWDSDQIIRACDRATGLVHQLATFSRRAPHEDRALDPTAVIEGVAPMLRRLLGEHIELVVRHGRKVGQLLADPGQLEQVIVNLAINARDAMPDGGRLLIETSAVKLGAGDPRLTPSMTPGPHVCIEVSDTGVGMDEPTLGRIFEPFFTTKERGRGSGMGLAIVYGIVEQSGGSVTVDSAPGRGTRFTILLPRVAGVTAEDGDAATGGDAGAVPRRRRSGTVLLVEDDEAVRRFAQRVLRSEGFEVLATASGAEALAVAADHPEWSGLLVSDVLMPGMSGPDLADRLAALRTDLRVLFISGHAGDAVSRLELDREGRALLLKPFSADVLASRVGELIDGSPSARTST